MSESAPTLRLVTWNVNRSSIDRFSDQLTALQEHTPDIVALQEVGVKASREARKILRDHGFKYAAHSHEFRPDDPQNSSGIAFASRWPFRVLPPETFDMPYKHQALSAVFHTPFGRVEGHSVHILPGSQYGEEKVEMFEAVYEQLAADDVPKYRFLCGDFNSPQTESDDGEVTVWGSDDRWVEAERSVIVGLADYDLADAYRAVNGYGDDAYSFVTKNQGSEWRRRFDHVFASEQFNATTADYLHQHDSLSDHTPLKVMFAPQDTQKDVHTTSVERTSPLTRDSSTKSEVTTPSFSGLTYDDDNRTASPDANYRRGRFKAGWNNAVEGTELNNALDRLTWENLGWRLGKLFGETGEQHKETLYEWCVTQQVETENHSS